MAAGKKTGQEYTVYYNSSLLVAAPSTSAFPSGFSSNLLVVRDVTESLDITTVDLGERGAAINDQAQLNSTQKFTITKLENPADPDFVILDDAANLAQTAPGTNLIALCFASGPSNEVPLRGYVGNFSIVRSGSTQSLREGVLVTFECTKKGYGGRFKVTS